MPSGRVHEKASLYLVTPASVAAMYLTGGDLETTLGVALGVVSGIQLTPDLDVDHPTRSQRKAINKNWLLGWLWYWYWWPYAKLMPHRTPWSHWPILGTAVRLLYLWPFWLLWWWVGIPLAPWEVPLMRGWVVGLIVSDTAHFVMDFW